MKTKTSIIFCIIIISFSLFSCMTLPFMHDIKKGISDIEETYDYTPEETYNLGKAVAANLIGNYNLYYNENLYIYLNSICQSIVINSEGTSPYKGYFIGVLDSDIINAFATPGGHILITRGMLDFANTEDELAAIIAHEISHVQLEHSLNAIKTNTISQSTTNFLSTIIQASLANSNPIDRAVAEIFGEEIAQTFSSVTITLIDSGYSQKSEFEADENAINLMNNTGYNPNAMLAMLKNLQKNTSSNYSLGFGKTHPSPQQRIKEANKVLKKIKQMNNYNEESRISRFEQAKQYF